MHTFSSCLSQLPTKEYPYFPKDGVTLFHFHFHYFPAPKRSFSRLGRRRRARTRLERVPSPVVLDAEKTSEKLQDWPPSKWSLSILVTSAPVYHRLFLVV